MKKILILVSSLVIFCLPVCSYTIKGGILYNVDNAREVAFWGVDRKINMSVYKEYLYDPNYYENIKALNKGKSKYKKRLLTRFDTGSYAILYLSNDKISFYYDKTGKLEYVSKDIRQRKEYPFRAVKYGLDGSIDSIALYVKSDEQFVFDSNGKFLAHWLGQNSYNERGELINSRN